MSTKGDDIPKITTSNTKKEMLDAYNKLRRLLENQAQSELKPEKAKEEREREAIVQTADTLTTDQVIKTVNELKSETSKALNDIAARLEQESERYNKIKRAIEIKERELQEIFEIEKTAFTLAALLQTQKQQKFEFEADMTQRRQLLEADIAQTRADWERQKKQHAEELKEQKEQEEKRRRREKEEYEYTFEREKEQKLNQLTDEINKLEKEIEEKRGDFERQTRARENELTEREQMIAEREKLLDALQAKVDAFPRELERQVGKAVQDVTARLTTEASRNEQLLESGFGGEKNVLQARIDALQQVVDTQKKQIDKLTEQLESAYGKVQDIAVQAVASSSRQNAGSASIRPPVTEQG